ncbi:MAG: response regulator [Desulfatiglandales bacterium]
MEIKKILVADDEDAIRAYIERKLDKLGYKVFSAKDGEEALEQTFSNFPDLILLDVKMPKLTGIEACKIIKSDERTKHIPVIMLSAKAQSHEIETGLRAGADKYLCKPLGFPDILKEIQAFGQGNLRG